MIVEALRTDSGFSIGLFLSLEHLVDRIVEIAGPIEEGSPVSDALRIPGALFSRALAQDGESRVRALTSLLQAHGKTADECNRLASLIVPGTARAVVQSVGLTKGLPHTQRDVYMFGDCDVLVAGNAEAEHDVLVSNIDRGRLAAVLQLVWDTLAAVDTSSTEEAQ